MTLLIMCYKKAEFGLLEPTSVFGRCVNSLWKAETGNPWRELYTEHSYPKAPCLNDPTSRNKNVVGSSNLGLCMNAHRHTHLCVCIFTHKCLDTHVNMHMHPLHTTKRKGVEIETSTFKLHIACLL